MDTCPHQMYIEIREEIDKIKEKADILRLRTRNIIVSDITLSSNPKVIANPRMNYSFIKSAEELYRFIETTRYYISRILACNRVVSPEKSVSVFDDKYWRSFWYDPISGYTAMSAWNSEVLKYGTTDRFLLPKDIKATKLACKGRYAVYQLPPAEMLPYTSPTYIIKRLKDMDMKKFHNIFPEAVVLIEIPFWTDIWCQQKKQTLLEYKQ